MNFEIEFQMFNESCVCYYLLVYAIFLVLGSGANPAQENHSLWHIFTNMLRAWQ